MTTPKRPVRFHDLSAGGAIPSELLLRTEADLSAVIEQVKPIIEAVRLRGDAALIEFAHRFDGVSADATVALKVEPAEFDAAFAQVEPDVIEAITFGAANIRTFHQAQMPEAMWFKEVQPGVYTGDRHVPLDSVACYVPRGKGSFPSVVLQTGIPAVVAGVRRPVILTPPGRDGRVDAATLVAARLVGITEVYACGGAQAVAAAAFGTETLPRCHKIVGPGSPYLVAAKRLLAEVIDPGVPAGPSESIILADGSTDGRLAALDLMIESEHGPDSSAWLVADSRTVAEQAIAALPDLWSRVGAQRAAFSQAVLCGPHGGVVLAADIDHAIEFVNAYAPEHLQLLTEDPWATLSHIRHAGEVLLGRWTPITLGNFVLGPNAVLPTGGKARTVGPLSVFDFLKRNSVGYVTKAAYPTLAKHARRFAQAEGFEAHALAVSPLRDEILRDRMPSDR